MVTEHPAMSQETSAWLLHVLKVEFTVYISLIVANFLFGVLHPENKLIAIGGVVFFTLALLRQLYVERSFNVR
jgi:hypothetical protein